VLDNQDLVRVLPLTPPERRCGPRYCPVRVCNHLKVRCRFHVSTSNAVESVKGGVPSWLPETQCGSGQTPCGAGGLAIEVTNVGDMCSDSQNDLKWASTALERLSYR